MEKDAVPFAAVLLAGGRSLRMGRDKALLPLPDGRLLWQRQLGILDSLGPAELFISGYPRADFPKDVTLLPDKQPGLGPLSGIVAALETMTTPLLVVMAVDLPAMNAPFLRRLLSGSRKNTGKVPQHADTSNYYEPLAAVYPQSCLALAQAKLQAGELALQGFIHAAGPQLEAHHIAPEEEQLFANWNEPRCLSLAKPRQRGI